jgi:hypothetical protein
VNRTIIVAATASLAISLPGCTSQYKKEAKQEQQAQQIQTQPVNCATAQSDLQTLQNEKVNTAKQAEAGASAILPIGLVAGLVTGTENEKGQVAIGDYNKAIDKAIAHIKASCNIQ